MSALNERVDRRHFLLKDLPNLAFKTSTVVYTGISLFQQASLRVAEAALLGKSPEQEPDMWVEHWDGTWKRRNPEGGIKFVIIPGLGSTSKDEESFKYLKQALYSQGYDEHDVLDISYRINNRNPLLGEHYDHEDSTQHPDISLRNIDKLLQWYRKNFPEDKFVFIGHSQGGYIAHNSALKHADKTAAVIALASAVKGADIIPTPTDTYLAPIVGGEAGKFYLERAQDENVDYEVESEAAYLVNQGIYYTSFASLDDIITSPKYAHVRNSTKELGGKRMETLFSMGKWVEYPVSSLVDKRLETYQKFLNFFDAKEESQSAQLKRMIIVGGWDGHGAVLVHPKVLEQIKYIVGVLKSSNENRDYPSLNSAQRLTNEDEDFLKKSSLVGRMLNNLPFSSENFRIENNYDTATITVEISSEKYLEGYQEFYEFLWANGIEDTSWIKNLEIIYQ